MSFTLCVINLLPKYLKYHRSIYINTYTAYRQFTAHDCGQVAQGGAHVALLNVNLTRSTVPETSKSVLVA